VPLGTLQVISETVLQAITCTGTDQKISSKSNQSNTQKKQNSIIYHLHTHAHRRNCSAWKQHV